MSHAAPTFDESPERSASAAATADSWAPKRQLTLAAARAHTRRVRLFQVFLIAIAAGLLALLVFQFATRTSTVIIKDNPDEAVRMISPRYIGRTSDGLPFTLTAETAIRERANPDEVELAVPLLNFYRVKGVEASTVDAITGVYNEVEQVLNLRQEVILNTDDGNQCTTTHARIYLVDKRIEGDEPIRCSGSFGIVEGNAYEILDDYRTFIFKDGMTGVLEGDAKAPELEDEL